MVIVTLRYNFFRFALIYVAPSPSIRMVGVVVLFFGVFRTKKKSWHICCLSQHGPISPLADRPVHSGLHICMAWTIRQILPLGCSLNPRSRLLRSVVPSRPEHSTSTRRVTTLTTSTRKLMASWLCWRAGVISPHNQPCRREVANTER